MRWSLLALACALVAGCPGPVEVAPPAAPDQSPEISMDDSVPPVPHSAESCGHDCLSCHATGRNGAPPQAHPGRTECLHCHIVLHATDQ